MQASRFSVIKHALLLSAVAAACAAPLLCANAAPPSDGMQKVRTMHRSEGGEPYALIKRSGQGEFFWFRKDGKEYIVQDPALLERVRHAWAPLEKTGVEMEKHGKEMGRHGELMGAHGNEMALAAVTLNRTRMETIGKKMEEAGKPMEALGKKMEVLGEQMEAQQKGADRATRGIIVDAVASGKTRPAPQG